MKASTCSILGNSQVNYQYVVVPHCNEKGFIFAEAADDSRLSQ